LQIADNDAGLRAKSAGRLEDPSLMRWTHSRRFFKGVQAFIDRVPFSAASGRNKGRARVLRLLEKASYQLPLVVGRPE